MLSINHSVKVWFLFLEAVDALGDGTDSYGIGCTHTRERILSYLPPVKHSVYVGVRRRAIIVSSSPPLGFPRLIGTMCFFGRDEVMDKS